MCFNLISLLRSLSRLSLKELLKMQNKTISFLQLFFINFNFILYKSKTQNLYFQKPFLNQLLHFILHCSQFLINFYIYLILT
jgi:hypothetical protein